MGRGRKPKPAEIHYLNNDPSKRGSLPTPPKSESKIGTAPKYLTKEQKALWRSVVKHAPAGLLTYLDRTNLIVWCVACDVHRQALEKLNEGAELLQTTPNGFDAPSGYLSVMNRQAEIMKSAASELGFSPVARTRIGSAGDGEAPADNPFANNG